MYPKLKVGIPIIKGTNDCFFAENSDCLHKDKIHDKCPRVTCRLYRPIVPLQRY